MSVHKQYLTACKQCIVSMSCQWAADEPVTESAEQHSTAPFQAPLHSTAPQHRSTAPLTASAKTLVLFAELSRIWKRYTLRCNVLERQALTAFTLSCIIIVATTPPYLHLHQDSNNFVIFPIANIAKQIMLASFFEKSVEESQTAYVNRRKNRHHQKSFVSKGIPKLIHENATLGIDCMQCGNPLTKFEICSNSAQ